jgi:hypothetical protein
MLSSYAKEMWNYILFYKRSERIEEILLSRQRPVQIQILHINVRRPYAIQRFNGQTK